MVSLYFNENAELKTDAQVWLGEVSDAELIDIGQLQARPAGEGCIAGLQVRVHGELCRRRLMGQVVALVLAGAAVPEELT